MVSFSKFAVVAGATLALASPMPENLGPLALFDELKNIPKSWTSQGAATHDIKIRAQIGLKQANIAKLQEHLLDISNPDSSNYGKWLSQDEVNSMTAPSADNIAAVKKWLNAAGVTDIKQPSADWIEFTAPVSQMEKLLNAKYEMFKHNTQGHSIPRTKQYSLPKELHGIVDMVTPTTAFYENIAPHTAPKHQKYMSKRQSGNCANAITPDCIRQIYNVDYTSSGSQTIATTEYQTIAASHDDFATFGQTYQQGLQDFQDQSISGGSNAGQGDENTLLEGNLDTQYAGALSSPNSQILYSVGPQSNTLEGFNDEVANFASYITSNSGIPPVISTSYANEENNFSSDYLDRVCNEFMKAGATGISLLFASGDSGVGGIQEQDCSNGFYKTFPASCPWVTAVGGTEFNGGDEEAAQFNLNGYAGGTGGGYSDHFAAPSYQTSDVANYANNLPSSYNGYQNSGNRGYPDVSLISLNYQVIANGQTLSVLGTSASTPAVSAFISVLNDYRHSKGGANLGFLNPLFYGKGRSALRDITSGNNRGCNTDGYPAATGWDATTGLGVVDFAKLRALI